MNVVHPNHVYNGITIIHDYNMKLKNKHDVASTIRAAVMAILLKRIKLGIIVIIIIIILSR